MTGNTERESPKPPGRIEGVEKPVGHDSNGHLRLKLDELRVALQLQLQEGREVHTTSSVVDAAGFDVEAYRRLFAVPNVTLLTPEHMPHIGQLYEKLEMPREAFEKLAQGDRNGAREIAADGCLVDKWKCTPAEAAVLRDLNSNHKCSGDELAEIMAGNHGRSAKYHTVGLWNEDKTHLHAMASAFLPQAPKPLNHERVIEHGREVQNFLQKGRFGNMNFRATDGFDAQRLEGQFHTVGEIYMVIADTRGAGAVVLNQFLLALSNSQKQCEHPIDVRHWTLNRFATMRTVYPHEDSSPISNLGNEGSFRFFSKYGFHNCGECDMDGQFAARELEDGSVVGARHQWKVMYATHEDVVDASQREMVNMERKAIAAGFDRAELRTS